MKGSVIIVYLWVEFIAILHGSTLRAQQTRPHIPVISHAQVPVKNNFTSFTRKYTSRGIIWQLRNRAFLSHPDANFTDQYSPGNKAVEIFEKRTIDSKFYINKDNPSIVYSQRSSGPMHFKKNGQWITIDSRLNPKGPFLYEASNQEDPLGFDIKKKSSYIIAGDDKTYFNDWKLYGKNEGAETLLANADWTHFTAGDDGIAIKNIFPGIDAEMKVSRGSIKTNFIVHANKFSRYKTLLFRDSFISGRDGSFSFSNGLSGNGLISSADFLVGGATAFRIKKGVMYQKEKPSSAYQYIPYYLDHNKLTLAISSDFLNASGSMGDVIIDPQVMDMGMLKKGMINGSHSNSDCSLDSACEYDFTVPLPAGATITDAQFSFEFTANNPCAGQDGAFTIGLTGGCISQMYVGTAPGPGPQNFPNQSILLSNGANLASCFPAPVCGLLPQSIPFSFFFYRSCHGPEGCDGSCISASKDLIITIVGRTFDSASVTASPLNSCAGAPVTLTARGYYGVGPYSFTWQGLPQYNGDSVITVNPTTNTTYTVQVNDACIVPVTPPVMKSINVTLLPKPPTPALSSNSPVCTGGQLVLSVNPVPGTTFYIANPGAGLGGGQYSSVAVFNNVTASYAGTWIAVATDANGCTSDTATTNVVISPTLSPTATITASATNICAGTLVTFNATAINAGSSPTYQWLLNSQKVGTNSPTYSGNSFANNDAISCIVSANGPCAGGFDVSNIIVLQVNAPVTPTFNAIGPLCQNSTPPALPLTSKEGITGTWNPASINTSALGTGTYTFTPAAGSCANPASLNISIVGTLTPTFNAIGPLCQNSAAPVLPLTSKEGIAGTWNPASINTSTLGTVTYTFTPSAGCASQASLNITILPTVSPTFPTIATSYCQNAAAPALPATSKEGIAGTWNPASINTSVPGNVTYTFTPTAGNCATQVSLNITIVPSVSPTFPTIANSYCQNATAPALPATSNEGITGTWSPASINTSVLGNATYVFTPAAGSCAAPVSLSISIVSTFTPIFDPIGPLCQNSTPPDLPPTSKEGIPGTWNPASINTTAQGTVTYTFTPSAGGCSNPAFLNITIVGSVSPTFPTIANSYCQNTTVPALPATSNEGITGTWSPSSINTSVLGTATYTFTPSAGSCANSASLSITIVSTLTPTFDAIGPLCQNSAPPALPSTSKEGVTGSWSPASINTSVVGTSAYQFTPSSAGNCAIPASINITIATSITPTFPTVADSYCQNDIAPALPATSKEGIDGTWNPSSVNTATVGSTVYTFTPKGGQCGVPAQITIAINAPPVLNMGPDLTIADGASTTLNVSVTGNIVSYQWKPSTGLNNTTIEDPVASPSATTTYTLLVIDDNNCEASGSIKITVSGQSKISVPNAFSPNGDGINDTWVITNLSIYPGATVDVFNRYGQPVFHSVNSSKAWDGTYNGKPLPVGTYYYIIDLKNNEKKMAGSVTIFR